MDWTALFSLIPPELLIVVATSWVLGFILKQTTQVPDWSIVYIVTVFAVVITVWMLGFTPKTLLEGILCGAVSVYGHQLVKQGREGAIGR